MILRLAFGSLYARSLTVGMTTLAISLSVALFLGVEKVRNGTRASFADTISDTDLIVGARSGSVQLLLYSVFRIGNATNNVSWESYQDISDRPEVKWIVPISLGDSHRQFRVMGTTKEFFKRYKFRGGQPLRMASGHKFENLYDTVIGADVAATLNYAVDTEIVVAHGLASFIEHEDHPFRVSGILEKTGTPVDRTVIVSLEAIEAIHIGWYENTDPKKVIGPIDDPSQIDLTPKAVTAALVGVNSHLKIFKLQRWINEYTEEPLLAVLPGVALQELWQIVGVAEVAMMGVSVMVVVTALMGMVAMTLSNLGERRREMAILRAMGAQPRNILGLLVLEASLMASSGALLGVFILYLGLYFFRPLVDSQFGIWLPMGLPSTQEVFMLLLVVLASVVASFVPAFRAYRLSISDGMMVRI